MQIILFSLLEVLYLPSNRLTQAELKSKLVPLGFLISFDALKLILELDELEDFPLNMSLILVTSTVVGSNRKSRLFSDATRNFGMRK